MLNIFSLLVIFFLVISKLSDFYYTQKNIDSPYNERNPIARRLMLLIGTDKGIVTICSVAALIILTVGGYTIRYGTAQEKIVFITLGVIISIIQSYVSYRNFMVNHPQ